MRPNMSLKMTYDFIWLNQVALAPQQMAFTTPAVPRVFSGGSALLNGASLGLEYTW